MSPSSPRQAVIVGLFVTVGIVILAGGIMMIGSINDSFTRKITVSAVFDEVNGLTRGDNIWLSGVKVGVVSDLRLHGASQVEVQMKIDEAATPFIHGDALARVSSDGLIGNKLVVLTGGSAQAPMLAEGDLLAVETSVSTEQIMATMQQNNENLLAFTTDLKAISAGVVAGDGNLGRLLQEEGLYEGVQQTVGTLQGAATDARAIAGSLASFSADLNREGSLPRSLVTDQTIYPLLTGAVTELKSASTDSARLMEGLARGVADHDTPVGALMGDEAAGADVKGSLENLHRASALLAEDLEALQHNFLFRRYFKKKARDEAKAVSGEIAGGSP